MATLHTYGHGGLSGRDDDFSHDHAFRDIGRHIKKKTSGGGRVLHREGEGLGISRAQVERGRKYGEATGIDAEDADGRFAGRAAEGYRIILSGRKGRNIKAEGCGGVVGRADGGIIEIQGVLRGEAATEHAYACTDGTAIGFQGENVTVGDADFVEFRIGHPLLIMLDEGYFVVHQEIVGQFVAAGREVVIEFVVALAHTALGHQMVFTVYDDMRTDAAIHDIGVLLLDLERDRVDPGWIFRERRRGDIGERDGLAAGEQCEAEKRYEPEGNFPHEREAGDLHWFSIKTGQLEGVSNE